MARGRKSTTETLEQQIEKAQEKVIRTKLELTIMLWRPYRNSRTREMHNEKMIFGMRSLRATSHMKKSFEC